MNDAFARLFGTPETLLGRSVTSPGRAPRQIMGVVGGLRYGAAVIAEPQIFIVSRAPRAMTVVAKVQGAARDRLSAIRDAAQSVDPRVPIFDVKSMEQRLEAVLARPKFNATAVTFFGGLGLLLAVVGIYSIVSFAVSRQTREKGVRLALGATPRQVRSIVLGRTLIVVGRRGWRTGARVDGRNRDDADRWFGGVSGLPASQAPRTSLTCCVLTDREHRVPCEGAAC